MISISQVTRLKQARLQYESCHLCEHNCSVNRTLGERGVCKADARPRVFRHRIEYGEELELIPSHLFYLSGCDLRCAFCIAEENAFDPSRGSELTAEFLQPKLDWGVNQGAKNIQWVGGEPTIHLPGILDTLNQCRNVPPVIWKSDFYGTPEAFELLDGVVDSYVADFKFGNNACAQRIAGIENYMEVITRNLRQGAKQGNLIVRHLLLPDHFECCFRPIVRWMTEFLPDTKFSIRGGYLPKWRAAHFGDLGKRLPSQTLCQAEELALEFSLNVIE